jgi:hypothetical protein
LGTINALPYAMAAHHLLRRQQRICTIFLRILRYDVWEHTYGYQRAIRQPYRMYLITHKAPSSLILVVNQASESSNLIFRLLRTDSAGSGNDNVKHSPFSFSLSLINALSYQLACRQIVLGSHAAVDQFCSGGHLFSRNTISFIVNVRERVTLKHRWVLLLPGSR